MTIDASDRIIAALQALDASKVAELPPAERRRLVEALATALRMASTENIVADAREAMSGVLAELKDGRGRH
jgi:hypothetical protein